MIKRSEQFNRFFQFLSEISLYFRYREIRYEDMINSNQTRLDTINRFFDMLKTGDVLEEEKHFFDENIDFIYNYMNNINEDELSVPLKYFEDMERCTITPSNEDLEYLLSLIKKAVELYEQYYKDTTIELELPNNTFNMNMTRSLSVKYENLAHLLGLTESSLKDKDDKNLLMKYFLENIDDKEKYGDTPAIQLINWIISPEGKRVLIKLNEIVLSYLDRDRYEYPSCYDKDGNIKPDSYDGFIKRLNKAYEPIGLVFPIIKYSRWLVKTLNTLNFFNMENINQVIVDYNSKIIPGTDSKVNKSEKDIYIVSASQDRLNSLTKSYLRKRHFFEHVLELSKYDDGVISLLKNKLKEMGIKEKDIDSFINLIINKPYYDKNGISIDSEYQKVLDQVNKYLSSKYNHEIHFIGFGTNYDRNPDGSMKTYELSDSVNNTAHCDTSLSLDIITLINEYYKRGRAFFIDKVVNSKNDVLRISTPLEELEYYSQLRRLGIPVLDDYKVLLKSFKEFNSNYGQYKQTNNFDDMKRQ